MISVNRTPPFERPANRIVSLAAIKSGLKAKDFAGFPKRSNLPFADMSTIEPIRCAMKSTERSASAVMVANGLTPGET
jgi:hypothetical protein